MSRSEHKPLTNTINAPLMKVNEIINSIFALNQSSLFDQLQTCSKIVSQLLHNQLINHIASIGATKLLCYQLVLLIAEENAVQSRPRLSLMENVFGNNKKIKLTASLRNTLTSLQEVLEEMIWKNQNRKRGSTEKKIIQNSPLYQGYVQFKHLLTDFDNQLSLDEQQNNNQTYLKQKNKKTAKKDESESEQNQALIEQLQQIISKKQRRIKQLNEQLQQIILDQKAQQDLIAQLQSRNIQLKQQLRVLNYKLTEKDQSQLNLQQIIENLKAHNLLKDKQLLVRKTNIKTEKTIKTRFTIDDEEEPTNNKKQYRDFFEDKPQICSLCEQKKDISIQDVNNLRRLLMTQAMSIEALI